MNLWVYYENYIINIYLGLIEKTLREISKILNF